MKLEQMILVIKNEKGVETNHRCRLDPNYKKTEIVYRISVHDT